MPAPFVRCPVALGLTAAILVAVATLPAEAKRSTTREAAAQAGEAETGTSWASGVAPADCRRSRRKLWQDGEGWVVKTIGTCR